MARLGYVLIAPDASNPWCRALVAYFSPAHSDHVASVNGCAGCDETYTKVGVLGWVLGSEQMWVPTLGMYFFDVWDDIPGQRALLVKPPFGVLIF